MKNKNTIIKVIFVFISLWLFVYANAADINLSIKEIKKDGENTLKINFDTPMPDSWLSWEMKVFKDLWITSISKDSMANNKINISLEKDIKVWSTYNIFSVFWVEWSADFIVEDSLNTKLISQAPESQWITKITVKDKKNIVVEFKNPLIWNEFEFKILEDLSVVEISSLSWNLLLKTSWAIENNTAYILIMISLSDKINNYNLGESIFDFNIWNDSEVKNNDTTKEEDTLNAVLINAWQETGQEAVNVEIKSWTWVDVQSLNLENWSGSLWNIENIAIKAKTTPDTGPETWVLMFLTLIINSIYFLTRKFSH